MKELVLSFIVDLYHDGGFIIVGLFGLSVYLYVTAFRSLLWTARVARHYNQLDGLVKEQNWIEKVKAPWRDFLQETVDSQLEKEDIQFRFKRSNEGLSRTTRSDLLRLKISIAAAPLLGLLGTIIGMIDTFDAISYVAGSDTSVMVARGISKALITTNAGLAIALPALFISYLIRRKLRQALVVAETFENALWKQKELVAK